MLPSPLRALGRKFQETTPDELHLAVITGRTKKIKNLIHKGVHIESVNFLGQTPLFSASFGGDLEVVEVLLRLGANPNRRCGTKGSTPAHAAAYRGSRRVLRALVEAGASLCVRDCDNLTPREYALKQPSPLRQEKILKYLDLLSAMMVHRLSAANLSPSAPSGGTSGSLISDGRTLASQKRRSFLGGSQLSLTRRTPSFPSSSSVWSSCVSDLSLSSPSPSADDYELSTRFTGDNSVVITPNLHQNVSCHLLDQLCVTTSLPLLTPAQLRRPATLSPAYTCGGPTVYSSFTWLGTPVTVRRPTPALSMSRKGIFSFHDDVDESSPDQDAVRSLLQELAFLRRIRHPGFLEVMAACHVTHPSPDHVTLIYQHVPHGSLYHHLHVQHRDLLVGGAVDILIGLVEALLFMHAHGFFHCGLSSHAIHLVALSAAKLGGFEYAFESKVKGVGMRAEHLAKAGWLIPWQAPETVVEKMVSVRSEVYGIASVMWELWSGMAPWTGVEEEEVRKRICQGEILPPLKGSSPSLISYLTEYGLKWNAHERELDLQEMHTMLRSMRIQCNGDERVPIMSSWGPPSVPNTPPVSCRESDADSSHYDRSRMSSCSSTSSCSSGDLKIAAASPGESISNCTGKEQNRHSFSCSLENNSETTATRHSIKSASLVLNALSSRNTKCNNSGESLSKFEGKPPSSRPLSVFTGKATSLDESPSVSSSKTFARRSLDSQRHNKGRKHRRKHDIEFEEEFIDDEFDANLFDQPHMQLSVGSSENLLDNKRLSISFDRDTESCSSGDTPCRITSSDDEVNGSLDRTRILTSKDNLPINLLSSNKLSEDVGKNMNIHSTDGTYDNGDARGHEKFSCKYTPDEGNSFSDAHTLVKSKTLDLHPKSSKSCEILKNSTEDLTFNEKITEGSNSDPQESPQGEKKNKFKALTLERSFKYYMPKYSIDSDSEGLC